MASINPVQPEPLPADTRRIVVLGTSGSGKTSLAQNLSQLFGVPHVEFDAYRHGPNWTETPDDIFRVQLAEALQGECWVADGNYSVTRDVVWPRATALVWLDYPMRVVLWRLFWRILRRGIFRQELWNGNKENMWEHFFTKDSMFVWVFKTHWLRRRTMPVALSQPEYGHLRLIHLRSPKATKKWFSNLDMQN